MQKMSRGNGTTSRYIVLKIKFVEYCTIDANYVEISSGSPL
jgi:hypothetical protein